MELLSLARNSDQQGREIAAILRAVRVAEHDRLVISLPPQVFAILGEVEHAGQDGRSMLQIVDGLEQRNDGEARGRVSGGLPDRAPSVATARGRSARRSAHASC